MKMKKVLSSVFAFLLSVSCMNLPVFAENTYPTWQIAIVGVNDAENPAGYVVCDGGLLEYLSQEEMNRFHPSQEAFQLGDILEFENIPAYTTLLDGMNSLYLGEVYSEWEPVEPYSISKTGSVFDNPQEKSYFVSEVDEEYTPCCELKADDGSNYWLYTEWADYGYVQPGYLDIRDIQQGDTVTCITYKDFPAFFTDRTEQVLEKGDTDKNRKNEILIEAYNKLDALLYPNGIGWRQLAPLDECLEMERIMS